jgi:hypothetical protein
MRVGDGGVKDGYNIRYTGLEGLSWERLSLGGSKRAI